MSKEKMSIDEQVALLMQGTEFGDDELKSAMGEGLRGRLVKAGKSQSPLRVYCGYDPTKADLHLGHTVTMRKLRQFQDLGHQAIFVIGSFTALVGDPSERDSARPKLSKEEVMENAETYTTQAFKILDPDLTEVRYNHEWLSDVSLENFTELASVFTVQQFLTRDNFANRYEKGNPIWLHEFIYALIQGYDAVTLKADVQVGGTEQLFNLLAGRKLQEARGLPPQIALTMPILVGTDGHMRMAKSTGNYIGIDEDPEEMYGKVMSIPDSAMPNYFRLVTRWTPQEIEELERALESGDAHPRDLKMRLAREIVGAYHGDAAVEPAEEAFRRVFQERGIPEELQEYQLKQGERLVDVMVASGAASSKSEARRLMDQGGVRLDDEVIKDINFIPDHGESQILRVGKRKFIMLVSQG